MKKRCRKHYWDKQTVVVVPGNIRLEPGAVNYVYPFPFQVEICSSCFKIRSRKDEV